MQYSPYSRTETEMQYNKGDDGNGWEVKKPEQEKQIESVEDDSKKHQIKAVQTYVIQNKLIALTVGHLM